MNITPSPSSTPAPRNPATGDVLVSSWGYDQTNVDFYQVVAVTPSSVKIRKISKTIVARGTATNQVAALTNDFVGAVVTKRVKSHGAAYSVRISDSATASLWDGNPEHETASGFGH
jgi:hypothetical protein